MTKSIKIGNLRIENQLCLAPMLGVNCTAFRLMCSDYGAGLVYSPMIHSLGLVKGERNRDNIIDFIPEERPLAAQIVGRDESVMAESLQFLSGADIIDINFGCPDKEILGQKMGAYFSKHPEQMTKIISSVISATDKPVTVKIRIGWDSQALNHVAAAKIAEEAGASAIAVHGRTVKQRYSGKANWTAIQQVKEKVSVPVIGNGDVWKAEDSAQMIEKTGCDMVMIGRGAMGNPHLFTQCAALLRKGEIVPDKDTCEKGKMLLEFIDRYKKVQKVYRWPEIKQHVLWFCTGADDAASKRRNLMKANNEEEVVEMIEKLFK
ncbi:tRNA dihydrouridine synthase DusB [Candidatus Woesearchaeota archaeon]|nr:tRNA dihydrouridine synthase DusB [Candidatus Woesearchaeota archaeon]